MSFNVNEDWNEIKNIFERECPNPHISEARMKCNKLEINRLDNKVAINSGSTNASMRIEKVHDRKGEIHIETKFDGEVTYEP